MTETINKPTSLCFFLPSLSTNRVVTSYHIGNLSPLWSLNLPFLLSSKTSHASYIDSKKFWGRLELNLPWKWNVKVKSLSHVWFFVTPWTVAYQASPSMGFPRQEYRSGLPFPSRGSSQPRDWTQVFCIAGRCFTSEPPGRPRNLP